MLHIFLIFVAFFYIVMASCFFTQWQEIMERHIYGKVALILSRLSLLVLAILWPLVVPLAYLELLLKAKNYQKFKGIMVDLVDDK